MSPKSGTRLKTPVRVKLRKGFSLTTGAGGATANNNEHLITDATGWTEFAALFETFRIHSCKVSFVPGYIPGDDANKMTLAAALHHNPGGAKAYNTPATLIEMVEELYTQYTFVLNRKYQFSVDLDRDSLEGATEDEAADKVSAVQLVTWLECPLASKTVGLVVFEWDVSFK